MSTATLPRLDDDQARILAAYGSGDSIAQICAETDLSRQLVANTVDRYAKYDRSTAARLVADFEAAQSMPWQQRQPAPQPDPQPQPEPESDDVDGELDDEPQPPRQDVNVNELLLRAAVWASGFPTINKLLDRIRQAVDELAPAVEAASREAAARTKVEQLRAQLAAAEAELRQVAQPTGRESTLPGGVTAKTIRAWATGAGITCPNHGKVPQAVVDAYVAAHPEVAR